MKKIKEKHFLVIIMTWCEKAKEQLENTIWREWFNGYTSTQVRCQPTVTADLNERYKVFKERRTLPPQDTLPLPEKPFLQVQL